MDDYDILANSDAIYLDACALVKIDVEEDPGSRISRILTYLSTIPVYTSFVGFGEFFNVVGKKETQKRIGVEGYLYSCRQLMIDFDMNKIQRVEPVDEKFEFIQLSKRLLAKYRNLGGGDVWHLMSVLELKRNISSTTFVSFEPKLLKAVLSEKINAVHGNKIDSELLARKLQSVNKMVG